MKKIDTFIAGAGISGLTVAWHLHQQGVELIVADSRARTGGVIHTASQEEFLLEKGPHAIMLNESLAALIKDLHLEDRLVLAPDLAGNRYLYFNGKLRLASPGPGIVTSGLVPWRSLFSFLKEPFVPPALGDDESIAGFFRRRLDQHILDNLINPIVSGIYAGDPEKLSLRSTFRKLYAMEQEHGSLIRAAWARRKEKRFKRRLASFPGGLSTLIRQLTDRLSAHIRLNTQVVGIKPLEKGYQVTTISQGETQTWYCQRVISTLPAAATARVFAHLPEALKAEMAGIRYAPMLLVYRAHPLSAIRQQTNGFGFLIPRKENVPLLGAIWSSALFPDRAPAGVLLSSLFAGGSFYPHVAADPAQYARLAGKAYDRIMGIAGTPPLFCHYFLKKEAIPQFHVGYYRLMEETDAFEKRNPGLFISGNWRSGVAIGDCVAYNQRLAGRVAEIARSG